MNTQPSLKTQHEIFKLGKIIAKKEASEKQGKLLVSKIDNFIKTTSDIPKYIDQIKKDEKYDITLETLIKDLHLYYEYNNIIIKDLNKKIKVEEDGNEICREQIAGINSELDENDELIKKLRNICKNRNKLIKKLYIFLVFSHLLSFIYFEYGLIIIFENIRNFSQMIIPLVGNLLLYLYNSIFLIVKILLFNQYISFIWFLCTLWLFRNRNYNKIKRN